MFLQFECVDECLGKVGERVFKVHISAKTGLFAHQWRWYFASTEATISSGWEI